ncbi:hypothetical protein [Hymenobacter actinosclerus]|uniref:Lipoprotein n=1 Tax=Hymenobacter actinosclerus TaxID=82805 RepID=A0A1I0A9W2_9BACT|nr:hypothetical protein [Hymenobacter actinosclerus]SES90040.1 hypothetical protein SAMN04487998_0613 [Hymenobacter actinosclerus]
MKKLLPLPALLAVLALASSASLTGCAASVQPTAVVVRPRPYHRPYYRPAPVVVAPRPVVVVPLRPVRLAPAPRAYYPYRPHRFSGRIR